MSFRARKQKARADLLRDLSRLHAVASLVPFLDRFPTARGLVENAGREAWDFFVTVAGVGVGLSVLDETISLKEHREFCEVLRSSLEEWHERAYAALEDLRGFVERTTDGGAGAEVGVGAWVIWNLKGDEPTQDEMGPAPAIGSILFQALRDWWTASSI